MKQPHLKTGVPDDRDGNQPAAPAHDPARLMTCHRVFWPEADGVLARSRCVRLRSHRRTGASSSPRRRAETQSGRTQHENLRHLETGAFGFPPTSARSWLGLMAAGNEPIAGRHFDTIKDKFIARTAPWYAVCYRLQLRSNPVSGEHFCMGAREATDRPSSISSTRYCRSSVRTRKGRWSEASGLVWSGTRGLILGGVGSALASDLVVLLDHRAPVPCPGRPSARRASPPAPGRWHPARAPGSAGAGRAAHHLEVGLQRGADRERPWASRRVPRAYLVQHLRCLAPARGRNVRLGLEYAGSSVTSMTIGEGRRVPVSASRTVQSDRGG